MSSKPAEYVGRGGHKLSAALDAFGVDPAGLTCADFGANIGGFTDCLLQRGAARVYAVDTGYGMLAWKLRKDARVVVMERTNALHADPPGLVDLVVIDMAWTPQALSIPAAMKWLAKDGRIVSLLKPHFELAKMTPGGKKPHAALSGDQAREVCDKVCSQLAGLGCPVADAIRSPIKGKGGTTEFLLLLRKQT